MDRYLAHGRDIIITITVFSFFLPRMMTVYFNVTEFATELNPYPREGLEKGRY